LPDLRELYQQIILDHHRRPHNFRPLPEANRRADGHNPLCGDEVHVEVLLEGDVLRDVAFQGSGCAISRASASLMTDAVKGKTVAEARALFERVHRMLTGERGAVDVREMGSLAALQGVRDYPVRVKCATLAWHTLVAALEGARSTVTTE